MKEPKPQVWAEFAKKHKRKVPNGFNEKLWEEFEQKINNEAQDKLTGTETFTKKVKLIHIKRFIPAVAASIAVFFSLYILLPKDEAGVDIFENEQGEVMSYIEKQAVLLEALSLVATKESSTVQGDILFEDEIITIYANPVHP